MSVCQTSTAPDAFVTNTVSSTGSTLITSTSPAQTITTSTASLATACVIPLPCVGTGPCITPNPGPCFTSTVFVPVTSTVPGKVDTITSFFTNVQVQTVTNKGAVVTSCTASPQPGTTPPPSATPTATPTTPTPTPTTPPVNTVPTASPTNVVPVVVPSSLNGISTITQYSTFLLTTMDSAGRMTTQTSVDAIPTTLQDQTGTNSSSNTGAIVGGVVGGLAGLLAIVVLAWFLRKRGIWKKSSDDPLFNDEMWSPAPHSPNEPELLSGAGAGMMAGGAMSERRTSYGLPGVGHHSAHGSFAGQDVGYGSHYVDVDGYGPVQGGAGPHETHAVGGYGGGERVAHRQSLQSGSGHSHDESYGSHYDNRLAPQQLYQPMSHGPGLLPYAYDYNDPAHREEVVERPRSSRSDHSDTVATTGSTNGNESRPSHSLRRPAMEPLPYWNSTDEVSLPSGGAISSGPSAASTAPSSPGSSGPGKMALPTLKRPTSSDSLQAPSQFLGARIVNLTPAIEHSSFNFLTSPVA